MRKRSFGRLLSAVLSATLAFTSVIPSYAMEGVDEDELVQDQEEAEPEEEESETLAEESAEEPAEEAAEEEILIEEDEDEELVGGESTPATIHIIFTDVDEDYKEVNGSVMDPSGTAPEDLKIKVGEDSIFTLPDPEREGYTFDSWTPEDEENVSVTEDGIKVLAGAMVIDEDYDMVVIKLTANWTANKYVVTFNAGDGKLEDGQGTKEVTFDAKYGELPTPKYEGYTFDGWFGSNDFQNANQIKADSTVATAAAHTLYAKYTKEPEKVKITVKKVVDSEDPVDFGSFDVAVGTPLEKALLAEGKDSAEDGMFVGFFTDPACELHQSVVNSSTAIEATTIYAKFTKEIYKVSLDKNCDDDVEGLPEADKDGFVGIRVINGWSKTYKDLPKLSREGYEFFGWFTQKQRGTEVYNKDSVDLSSDITLYAHWSIKRFRVDFDPNNAKARFGYYPDTVAYGTKVLSFAPTAFKTPEGYKLDGWYTSKDIETGELSGKVEADTIVTKDTSYIASWAPIEYTVKFNANGGKGTLEDQKRKYGDGEYLPEIAGKITRDNYVFLGWSLTANGESEFNDTDTSDITSEDGATVTLYAVWEGVQKTVTYKFGYEKQAEEVTEGPVTVHYGEAYPEPNPKYLAGNPGFYFDGWYDESGKKVDITKEKITEDIILTAKWTKVTYKATFNSNNSKKKTTKKPVVLDETKTEPMAFTDFFAASDAAGLVFAGWATPNRTYASLSQAELIGLLKGTKSATSKVVTTTLYAQWESAGTYNIKLNANLPATAKDDELWKGREYIGCEEPVNFTEPYILTGNEFGLYGYTLVGWTYKNAKGKTVTVKPAAKLVSLTNEKDKTVEVSAKWKATSYTLKYDLNGGVAAKRTKTTVKYAVNDTTRAGVALLNFKKDGENYVLDDKNQVVTKRGYTFEDWDGCQFYGNGLYGNLTLKARWSANTYDVNLDGNSGTVDGQDVYKLGGCTFDDPIDLSLYSVGKEGYYFDGWQVTAANGKTRIYAEDAKVSLKDLAFDADGSSFTIKATYKGHTNPVYILLNEEDVPENMKPSTYVTGEAKMVISDPVKPGYKFTGWKVVLNGINVEQSDVLDENNKIKANVDGNLLFIAQWERNTYSIEFYSADGKTPYGSANTEPVYYYDDEVDFTLSAEKIEAIEGFTGSVKGFATAPNAKKVTYALNKTYTKLAGKTADDDVLKLYVVGQPKVYRIYYNLDGGTIKNAVFEYKTPTKADMNLKTTAVKRGFTFKGFKCDDEYLDYVATNKDGFVTAIKKGANHTIVLTAVYDNEVSYSIVAMPNASDVVNAFGEVEAKKGVEFEYAGKTKIPISSKILVDRLTAYLGWSRPGYYFEGFATDKNGKHMIEDLSGLPYNKKNVATVYAIWTARENAIMFCPDAIILRNGKYERDESAEELGIKIQKSFYQKVNSKAVPISYKKLSAKGYTFKGWVLESHGYEKVTYTDKTKRFVKSVNKDNKEDVYLIPVFEENYYNLYINPNGGTYKGSKKKKRVGKYYYTDTLELSELSSDAEKSGCVLNYFSTKKNAKGRLGTTATKLSAKNKASVTLNAIWTGASLYKPTVAASIGGTTMAVHLDYGDNEPASDNIYEIQYSTSSTFAYDVRTVTVETKDEADFIVPVTPGKEYYLRARNITNDSVGKLNAKTAWSSTVRASKQNG
ncbi:MAG: InlB B-repeat-containing protein [Butyrivibrio sp.]|nr:InlB B-repeat-containing protein [Butyrivibrio sp.]